MKYLFNINALSTSLVSSILTSVLSFNVFAQSDEGDVQITLNVAETIQVSGLEGFNLNVTPGSSIDEPQLFCVYSNINSGTFIFSVSSTSATNSGDALALTSGGNSIPYSIELSRGNTTVTTTTNQAFNNNAFQADNNTCADSGDENFTLRLGIEATAIAAAPAATDYEDTLTITVAAQ